MTRKRQTKKRVIITADGERHNVIGHDNRYWKCEDACYLKYKEGETYTVETVQDAPEETEAEVNE